MYLGSSCILCLSSLGKSVGKTQYSTLGPWSTSSRPVTIYSDIEMCLLMNAMDSGGKRTHPGHSQNGKGGLILPRHRRSGQA